MSNELYKDPEWLRQKIRVEKKNYTQAAEEVSVNSKQIGFWANRYNIKKPMEDPEWLKEKKEEGWDTAKIADELGLKPYEVVIKLNQLGVVNPLEDE